MSTLKLYQWYMDATKCRNGNGVLNMVTAIWKFFFLSLLEILWCIHVNVPDMDKSAGIGCSNMFE